MYAYCGSNAVNFSDPHGTWTIGTAINYSMIAGSVGRAESLASVWDDDGFGDVQVSQSVSNLDNMSIQGLFCMGAGVSLQITNADTVNELLGESTSWGVNVGPAYYFGVDIIRSPQPDGKDVIGVQLNVGLGKGLDLHQMQSNTFSLVARSNSSRMVYKTSNGRNRATINNPSLNPRSNFNSSRRGGT